MGIETEYGITARSDRQQHPDPIWLSGLVVRGYAEAAGPLAALPRSGGWDYAEETPLQDARGFGVPRELADRSQLTDIDDPSLVNSVLSNGARLYVDHAHPEYSSPEVAGPLDAVLYDRAGEVVMARAAAAASGLAGAHVPSGIRLYKNNVDGKGASYGTHDNYLINREVPFARIVAGLLPFLAARPLICGAGRVGLGETSRDAGYQISARADYIETDVGLETTLRRPLVNTRDEPHATRAKHRRLHLISGDATLADVGGLLKVGSTSLVLRLIEHGLAPNLVLDRPVAAVRTLSRDLTLRATVATQDGRSLRGLDILELYVQAALTAYEQGRDGFESDADTDLVLQHWQDVLSDLRTDPMLAADRVDWVAKQKVLQAYRDRDGVDWDDPRLALIDIQYSDVDPARGLAVRLRAAGRLTSLWETESVERAVTAAPADTRAWFRGECVRRFSGSIRAASWDSVLFSRPDHAVARITLPEPLSATREQSEHLFTGAAGVDDFLDSLKSRGSATSL
ncbi:depupylase/deamidase Dop [soil metagenome]